MCEQLKTISNTKTGENEERAKLEKYPSLDRSCFCVANAFF